ncbi:hypothetical protein [Rubellimicrobium sp. CFH 75288]|uniref:hypothetical protein n=1 Tax=Rubellimicrobium sp. CFH 75288 TaxID=2697034 RepID=UPI001412ACDE|nr:hypothetical protein [Rubellimicrobium sp. CFH 75288]NAZ36845.1 hypothetical protein [Rubellimicrobium sp. CFH 75288]
MQALPGLAALAAAWVVLTAPGAWAGDRLVLRADLDGDGAEETWRLVRGEGDLGDLVVETAGESRTVRGIVWWGPMPGQEPWLDLSPAGSVRIGSGNDAVGRHRWQMVLTVAHRRGEAQVAGLTYTWRDTLDPAAGGRCDLNLLTGRGERETEAGAETVTGVGQAVPLWSWDEAQGWAGLDPCGMSD